MRAWSVPITPQPINPTRKVIARVSPFESERFARLAAYLAERRRAPVNHCHAEEQHGESLMQQAEDRSAQPATTPRFLDRRLGEGQCRSQPRRGGSGRCAASGAPPPPHERARRRRSHKPACDAGTARWSRPHRDWSTRASAATGWPGSAGPPSAARYCRCARRGGPPPARRSRISGRRPARRSGGLPI